MSQSKRASLAEAMINTCVGFFVALGTQMIVFPLFGVNFSLHQNLSITVIFTGVSIARSYLLRRIFNRHTEHAA